MNPTFGMIWGNKPWETCGYHPQVQFKHPRRYYRVRSLVRIAFWMPLVVWGYSMIMGAI